MKTENGSLSHRKRFLASGTSKFELNGARNFNETVIDTGIFKWQYCSILINPQNLTSFNLFLIIPVSSKIGLSLCGNMMSSAKIEKHVHSYMYYMCRCVNVPFCDIFKSSWVRVVSGPSKTTGLTKFSLNFVSLAILYFSSYLSLKVYIFFIVLIFLKG